MNEQKAVTEFDKGNQLLQEGKLEDAIAAYRHAIELNPANSWFHQQLGEALAKLGRFDEAVTAFCCAIKLKPDFSWSYHHLGDALAQQQKWEQAAEAFGKGIQLNPEHFGTYVGLGNTLAKLGQLDDAIAAYRRASELNADADWIHHALANALEERAQLDLAEAIVSHDQLEIHQAEECQLQEAIASYLEAVKQSPETFNYCHQLGAILARVNQPQLWEKAIALYQSIITQRSDLVWAHHFLGDALRNTQQWEAACQAYRKAIFLKPDFFWSYLFLGDCAFELGQRLEQAGQLQEAIASYLEAVKQSPETFNYCHQLGAILARVNQPQLWEKAIALYQSIITQRSDLVWAHHFLGDALRNTQQWEAACQAYRNAISLKPDFFWSYLFLGDCAKELQQWEEVITAHQRAVELKPETTNLNNNIGEAYYQVGKKYIEQNQLEKAVQCYQQALERQHSQKQAYYDLREAIARELYELGFQNAEVGLVSEGVAVFEKISMMETKREIYEYLWQGLNSLSLATLDETSRYCQNKIELEEATNYFQHTSDYKVIDMCALTADDKEYIQRVGLFLPALELIAQDNLTLEEIYINNFKKDDDSPLHLAQQVKRASNIIDYAQPYTGIPREEYKSDWQKGLYLQQSIVETGYVYTVCPFSGKVMRSNQS